MEDENLQGKIVLITGAAGGFGRAIASAFAHRGSQLALLDIDQAGLDQVTDQLRAAGATVSKATADLSTSDGVKMGIREVLSPYNNNVDILVANVGTLISGKFKEISDTQLHLAFAINFYTHVWACQAVLPLMRGRPGANIILMGSDQGNQPDAMLFPYAQAKSAVHNLGKMLARECASDGIRINVVAPGMSRTPLVTKHIENLAQDEFHTDLDTAEKLELRRRGVPLARLGEPEEIAHAVVYLATASFCTATVLNISGGNVRGCSS